mmetsp:Transcript_12790/g.26452  ORF Transcript_12790/g.26452 Transcript_12790/m.26452 type:complete len:298 (+) Transcript_12790:340-1233(+)
MVLDFMPFFVFPPSSQLDETFFNLDLLVRIHCLRTSHGRQYILCRFSRLQLYGLGSIGTFLARLDDAFQPVQTPVRGKEFVSLFHLFCGYDRNQGRRAERDVDTIFTLLGSSVVAQHSLLAVFGHCSSVVDQVAIPASRNIGSAWVHIHKELRPLAKISAPQLSGTNEVLNVVGFQILDSVEMSLIFRCYATTYIGSVLEFCTDSVHRVKPNQGPLLDVFRRKQAFSGTWNRRLAHRYNFLNSLLEILHRRRRSCAISYQSIHAIQSCSYVDIAIIRCILETKRCYCCLASYVVVLA